MKLWHQFQEGGWAMYPVVALGLVAVGTAARFALRGEHQLLAFIRWTLGSLLLVGAFGFTVGMMKVLHYAQGVSDPLLTSRLIMEGLAEAANNPACALMFGVISSVCIAVGQRRFPLPNPSAVPR
jgi:nitrate reductase NapE component